jgi:hypothetical protein
MIAMINQGFRLIPFPGPDLPAISVHGTFSLDHLFLTLEYSLSGDLESVLLPPASSNPQRKDELWKATCFEFFLAVKGQTGYWEFNLSPSGDWNAYRIDAYRRIGFREETAISQLPFEFQKGSDEYALGVFLDLTDLITSGLEIQLGIAAIVQTKDGNETYWALVHPASQPDFHARESFILLLAGQTLPSAGSSPDG